MLIFLSAEQPENASSPIDSHFDPIFTVVMLAQSLKALSPIFVIASGIVILVIDPSPVNASSPIKAIFLIPSSALAEESLVQYFVFCVPSTASSLSKTKLPVKSSL